MRDNYKNNKDEKERGTRTHTPQKACDLREYCCLDGLRPGDPEKKQTKEIQWEKNKVPIKNNIISN